MIQEYNSLRIASSTNIRAMRKNDIMKWIDRNGLISDRTDRTPSLNGIRYTVETLIGLLKLEQKAPDIQAGLKTALRACESPKRGVWMRTQDNKGPIQSVDDYTALGTFAKFFDHDIAHRILIYGKSHLWYFNQHPQKGFDIRGFMGRFPQLIAHWYWGAGIVPNWFLRLAWCISVLASTRSKHQDSWVLSWHLVITADGWIEKLVGRYFVKKCKKKWPNGIGQILNKYFNKKHLNGELLFDEFGDLS